MARRLAAFSHAVDLSAYTNHVVAKMVGLLNAADESLVREIRDAIDRIATEFTMARLEGVLASVRRLNAALYLRISNALGEEMLALVEAEQWFWRRMVGAIEGEAVSIQQVWAAATRQPMRGRLLRDYFGDLSQTRYGRISQTLALGFTEGKTIDEMVRSLRGTRAAKYRDGLLNVDRRSLEAVVRTATQHYASSTRQRVFEDNADIIDGITWLATLDTRTSDICRIRDGTEWTLDGKPVGHRLEWLGGPGKAHWNCRSTSVPILKGMDLSKGRQRASMDGPVSGKLTYGEWLKRQSAARQDEVLGPTRGALFRRGDYKLGDFHDNRGRLISIDQLRQRDRLTFKELGL